MSAHMKKKMADSGTFDAPEQDSLIMRLAAEAEVQNAQMRKAEKSSEKKTEATIREADPKNKGRLASGARMSAAMAARRAKRHSGDGSTVNPGSDRWPGFPLHELRPQGYNPVQLRQVGHSAMDLREAGYTAAELKAAGFTVIELKSARFRATELRSIGFKAMDLREARFRAVDLKTAGFGVVELKEVDFSAEEMKDAGFTATELRAAKYTAANVRHAARIEPGTSLHDAPALASQRLSPPLLTALRSNHEDSSRRRAFRCCSSSRPSLGPPSSGRRTTLRWSR